MGAAHWVHRIEKVEIKRYPDRAAARVAELQAIRRESPLYNSAGRARTSMSPSDVTRGAEMLKELECDNRDREELRVYQKGLYPHWCAEQGIEPLPKNALSSRQQSAYKKWEKRQLLFYAVTIANRRMANLRWKAATSDESKVALSVLMLSRMQHLGVQYTVSELVEEASKQEYDRIGEIDHNRAGIGAKTAQALLGRIGMRVHGTDLLFSNTSKQLRGLVAELPYAADLRNLLLSFDGASRNGHKSARFGRDVSKCVAIPLNSILERSASIDE
ncbi:hypothetical protein [Paraburkholderia sp. GAS348]|uniref:hypothetical protein n=1 Tax=Paraburkholderia sp. GAS348 TaxID=3035132 RepID=UPI003D1DA20B